VRVASADFVRSAVNAEDFLRDGLPAVAFAGRSNVGKSSVMNRLLGRKGLARTSSTPGRTQAVNYFLVNRRWYFVDLPGYGYARAAKAARRRWAAVIEAYLEHSRPRPLVVVLIDAKVGATPLDQQAYAYLGGLGLERRVVATKIDKVPRGRRSHVIAEIRRALTMPEDEDVFTMSALTGEGTRELWKSLMAFLDSNK